MELKRVDYPVEENKMSVIDEARMRLKEVEETLHDEHILLRIKKLEARNVISGMNFLNSVQGQDDSFIEDELNKEEILLDMKRLEINNTNAAIDELNIEKDMLESVIEEETIKGAKRFFKIDKNEEVSAEMIECVCSKLFPKGGQIRYNEDGSIASIIANK